MRKYLSDEHRELVTDVLTARGRVERHERTLRMLKGAKHGTAMRDAIDAKQGDLEQAERKLEGEVRKYIRFARHNHDALLLHWMGNDLMMDDLAFRDRIFTPEASSAATTG